MRIEEARDHVDAHVALEGVELAPDVVWYESRFDDGWLLVADRNAVAGAHHFTVLDDGTVRHDEGSLPPQWYVAKHSKLGEAVELAVVNEGLKR